jgi:membrane protease YdiL (CAAX protease family)
VEYWRDGHVCIATTSRRWSNVISPTAELIRRYPLTTYVVLAYAFSIALALLLDVSLIFGLIALFGPAAAAFTVARIWHGRAGVGELWAVTTRWRVHPGWYLAALALPIAGTAIGHILYVVAGNAALPVPGTVEPILLVLFFLVIGEEIGWRGFLLPGLLNRQTPLVATLVVAAVWTLWHSPLYFIPGMPFYGNPFWAFALWVVTFSFLLTWLWLRTRSALLAAIMHGAGNLASSLVFPLADVAGLYVFSAIGFAIVAIPLIIAARSRWISVRGQDFGDRVPSPQ